MVQNGHSFVHRQVTFVCSKVSTEQKEENEAAPQKTAFIMPVYDVGLSW